MSILSSISTTIKSIASFLRSAYSEPDGTGSSSRLIITLLILFILAAGASFAHLVHLKVITIEQFNLYLGAGASFIIVTCSPIYGMNKVSSAYNQSKIAKANNSQTTQPQPPTQPTV